MKRLALLIPMSLPLAGCLAVVVAAAAGATYGIVKYSENEWARDYRADLDTTWGATVAALRAAGCPVADDAPHGPTDGHVTTSWSDGEETEVWVARMPEGFTRVRMSIGTFETDEHERRCTVVLNDIGTRLGE